MKVRVGDKAPDFRLTGADGRSVRLGDYLGKKSIVLFFYVKDRSPVCVQEARAFRDSYEVFMDCGAEVIGINTDTAESHKAFAAANGLPFPLLSDTEGDVHSLYGIPFILGSVPGRVTLVIDRAGIIRHIFLAQFNGTRHVQEALVMLRLMGVEENNASGIREKSPSTPLKIRDESEQQSHALV